ncbi:MAG: patatin-like phospholipase family protein [Christensenellales bacterium]
MSKTLGIAFGGSGAQGIAGVAYVKALEALGIKPDIVSGTGIGAVVASMYAAGMDSDGMMQFMREVDFPGAKRPVNAARVKDAKIGILDGLGLEEYYQMIVPVKVFDRLYFHLKIVAANAVTGEAVMFTHGDVGRAVRCAAAVPGVFLPHKVEEDYFFDGSCVNPVPFDIIRDDCDVLAAVYPQIKAKEDSYSTQVFFALTDAYNAAKKALAEEKQKTCRVDKYESIILEGFSMYDFALFEDIIESAEEQAGMFALDLQNKLK